MNTKCIISLFCKQNINMNQILFNKFHKEKANNISNSYKGKSIKKSIKVNYILLFVFSITIFFISISYIIYLNYVEYAKSNQYYSSYDISKLYSYNNNINYEKPIFSIIGIIKIDKLKICYPILSETTDELLKIAPCRFAGPYPNEIGNLCVAGHNFDDNRFFGNLSKLAKDDEIQIFNSTGNMLKYIVFDKYETSPSDIDCLKASIDNIKEITLITCNNLNGNRLIVKAKYVT